MSGVWRITSFVSLYTTAPTLPQLFIGFYFGVDDATVCRTIKRLEPLLSQIIKIKREPVLKEKALKTLLVDATEQKGSQGQVENTTRAKRNAKPLKQK